MDPGGSKLKQPPAGGQLGGGGLPRRTAARFELALLVASIGWWAVSLLGLSGVLSLAGVLDLDLYTFFAGAAALGWLTGNLYVTRSRGLPRPWRRRLALAYLLGPPGLLFLARAMAPTAHQAAAPFAATWGLGVFALFFFVPVSLRRSAG